MTEGTPTSAFLFARTSIVLQCVFITKLVARTIGALQSSPDKASGNEIPPTVSVGVIGCGAVGRALVEGLLVYAGIPANKIKISTRRPEKYRTFEDRGIECVYDNGKVFFTTSLVFLCVPPSQLSSVAHDVRQFHVYSMANIPSVLQPPPAPSKPSAHPQNNIPGIDPLYSTKPKTHISREVLLATLPIPSSAIPTTLSPTITPIASTSSSATTYLPTPPVPPSPGTLTSSNPILPELRPIEYLYTLATSLGQFASHYLPNPSAMKLAYEAILGVDIGIVVDLIPDLATQNDELHHHDDDKPLYRATKRSNELLLETFRQNYLVTMKI